MLSLDVFFQVVEEERIKLQADVDLAAARLSRAGKLTQALADEKTRWEEGVKVCKFVYIYSIYVLYVYKI